jgi:hypothetical protein
MSGKHSDLIRARKIVESVIREQGLNPAECTTEAVEGGYAWLVSRGSAYVVVSLVPGVNGASGRIRVVSPLVRMEAGVSRDLAVRLLALNGAELPGVCFGLVGEKTIVLVAERSVLELDLPEAREMLVLIGYYADKYDDLLVGEFGGTRECDRR